MCGAQGELKAESHAFARSHPELHSLVADFFQLLFTQQPADPVAFAREHFASFACDHND